MKKVWVPSTFEGIAFYVVCPFCPDRRRQAINENMPWCATCGCEYRVRDRRQKPGALFDQALKTARYAWGKALNLSGGVKMGAITKDGKK